MADQPVTPPAPNGDAPQVTPPVPGSNPAEQPAAQSISFESFSDDEKKYLAGQGITKQEELTTDALRKVINHSQSSQKTAAERQAELDRIKQSINPTPANPDPFALPAQPTANPTAPTADPTNPTPPAQPAQGIDRVQAFTLANTLVGHFPELKDNLLDGSFYKDMNNLGIPTTMNGQVNLDGIMSYGKLAQERAQNAAKIAELEKPSEDRIPDANATTPQNPQPAADAPMTKQMALAIGQFVASGNPHARGEEAKQFLQKG